MGRALGAAVAVAALATLVTGCGGGEGGASSTSATAAPPTTTNDGGDQVVQGTHVLAVVDVHETEYRLQPKHIGFERTGYFALRAVNDGTADHALAVSGPGVRARTATIGPGKTATLVVWFRRPGVFRLFCPLGDHEERGMTATLRVR